MSEPSTSYTVPSGYPPGYGAPPTKPRPHGAWFLAPIGLFLAAVAVVGSFAVWGVIGTFGVDTELRANGKAHSITVPTDGDRLIWTDGARPATRCRVVDRDTGTRLRLQAPDSDMDRADDRSSDWTATWQVDSGSGHLDVTCAGPRGSWVEVGPAVRLDRIFIGFAVAGVLGLAGLVWLIWLIVVRSTRPARSDV